MLLVATVAQGGIEATTAEQNTPALQLKQLLDPLASISADFKQQIFSADDYLIQASTGHMQVAAPGKLRWLVNTPLTQWIIANGETLWVFDPDLAQVIVRPFQRDIAATPALLLAGEVSELTRHYRIDLTVEGGHRDFTLWPIAAESLYDSLTLSFRDDKPVGFTIVDTLAQRTLIVFENVSVNQPFDPQLFSFTPPSGVDVIYDD